MPWVDRKPSPEPASTVPPGAKCHQCGELIERLDSFMVASWRTPKGEVTAAVCGETCRAIWGAAHWRAILGPELSDPLGVLEDLAETAAGSVGLLKARLLRERASAEVVSTTA